MLLFPEKEVQKAGDVQMSAQVRQTARHKEMVCFDSGKHLNHALD